MNAADDSPSSPRPLRAIPDHRQEDAFPAEHGEAFRRHCKPLLCLNKLPRPEYKPLYWKCGGVVGARVRGVTRFRKQADMALWGVGNRAQGTAHSMAESTVPYHSCRQVTDSVASCLLKGVSTSGRLTTNSTDQSTAWSVVLIAIPLMLV